MVVNLGTPDAPTPAAVRAYLKEFLSDIRVVDLARWKWLPILHGVILPIRSRPVSRKYAEIWLPEGSPLAHYTSSLAAKIATIRPDWVVAPAMRYGSPSMTKLLASWAAAGVEDIRVLPLYPQYSVSTVASVQGVVDVEKTQRRHPAVDGHPDFFLLTQPGPLLAGQLDLAGPDREAAAIPAFGNFLPLAFQNFIQRNIDDFFKPLIFPFQRKRKTMGIYIKRFQ